MTHPISRSKLQQLHSSQTSGSTEAHPLISEINVPHTTDNHSASMASFIAKKIFLTNEKPKTQRQTLSFLANANFIKEKKDASQHPDTPSPSPTIPELAQGIPSSKPLFNHAYPPQSTQPSQPQKASTFTFLLSASPHSQHPPSCPPFHPPQPQPLPVPQHFTRSSSTTSVASPYLNLPSQQPSPIPPIRTSDNAPFKQDFENAQITRLTTELNVLKDCLISDKTKAIQKKKELYKTQEHLQKTTNEANALKHYLDIEKTNIINLEKDIKNNQEHLKQITTEKDELKITLKELDEKYKLTKDKYNQLQTNLSNKEKEVQSLEQSNSKLKSEIQSFKNQLNHLSDEMKNKKTKIESLKTKQNHLLGEIERKNIELKERELKIEEFEKRQSNLFDKNKELEERIEGFEKELPGKLQEAKELGIKKMQLQEKEKEDAQFDILTKACEEGIKISHRLRLNIQEIFKKEIEHDLLDQLKNLTSKQKEIEIKNQGHMEQDYFWSSSPDNYKMAQRLDAHAYFILPSTQNQPEWVQIAMKPTLVLEHLGHLQWVQQQAEAISFLTEHYNACFGELASLFKKKENPTLKEITAILQPKFDVYETYSESIEHFSESLKQYKKTYEQPLIEQQLIKKVPNEEASYPALHETVTSFLHKILEPFEKNQTTITLFELCFRLEAGIKTLNVSKEWIEGWFMSTQHGLRLISTDLS